VDGGINSETAKLVKRAGVDLIASASYISNNPDPEKVYLRLNNFK
jgi:pentose-5-phosphate-3-epimerase